MNVRPITVDVVKYVETSRVVINANVQAVTGWVRTDESVTVSSPGLLTIASLSPKVKNILLLLLNALNCYPWSSGHCITYHWQSDTKTDCCSQFNRAQLTNVYKEAIFYWRCTPFGNILINTLVGAVHNSLQIFQMSMNVAKTRQFAGNHSNA